MEEFEQISENFNDLSKQQVSIWPKKIFNALDGGTTLGRFFHPE